MNEGSRNFDITSVLQGWTYKPDEVTVRRIEGRDGKPKVQMRLPMGLIQMEIDGRPDGWRTEGYESYLDYYEARHHDSPQDFSLDPDDCTRLRDEATMYYHRYLSLFHLGDYTRVVRDTDRNLRCLDFIKRFADDTGDKLALEQYRPYIVMMNTRARAHLRIEQKLLGQALDDVREGIRTIEAFWRELDREEMLARSPELAILRQLEREIKEKLPHAKIEDLRHEMQKAIAGEDFERAAELRDEIRRLEEPV